jgi:energy-coupling factor transport system substrate-specific component
MSWPVASFAIVAGILLAGWIAYERRRPSARLAAIVAVMSALAALGRDAFAALPDVKPITAMTLVTGYALGPLPGFAVGALGMLTSNLVLGEGPYTPWQMAAWGGVGLIGAAAGALSRRRLRRLPLALACAVAAFAAKEVMNVYTWVLGASHTPAAFLLVAGQALAFDVTDIVASFLFGLAFAPELAHLLMRSRARSQVKWVVATSAEADEPPPPAQRPLPAGILGTTALTAALAIAATGLLACGSGSAGANQDRPARKASAPVVAEISYLVSAQNHDGGFGPVRGQPSSELYTAWAALGLAAAGRDPAGVRTPGGSSVLDSLRAQAASLQGAGDLERTILALHACGASTRSLPAGAGGDPVARLLRMQARDGSFGDLANLTAFGVLALRAAGYAPGNHVLRGAAAWLEAQQQRDGGFSFARRGAESDVDDTGAVLQALATVGRRRGRAIDRAVAYIERAQNLDGGLPQEPGEASNAQSTAFAVQGLIAVGRVAARVRHGGSRSPVAYLESLAAPDGSVRYSRTGRQTPVWVTAQALAALAGKPLPVAAP